MTAELRGDISGSMNKEDVSNKSVAQIAKMKTRHDDYTRLVDWHNVIIKTLNLQMSQEVLWHTTVKEAGGLMCDLMEDPDDVKHSDCLSLLRFSLPLPSAALVKS